MALTPAQLTAMRAAVFADASANALLAAGDANGLRSYLNAATNPAFVVWRTSVTRDEIMANGFDWTQADNLSAGQARIWEWLFDNSAKAMNPSKLNVRAGIDECWKGTAAKVAVATATYVHCKRTALMGERMLSTGAGSTGSPGLMTFEGPVSSLDAALLVFKDDGTIWTAQG